MKERKRTRLEGYDYSTDNLYFITSCVQDRESCFGEIVNNLMILNEFGKIAHNQFVWLQNQYAYLMVHNFVIMPDHVHAVVEINRNLDFVGNGRDHSVLKNPNPNPNPNPQSQKPLKIKSLSELVGAYKTTVSKQIHLAGKERFNWQKSFHDRIIRNEMEFGRIINYIDDNPSNWKKEKLNVLLTAI